MSAVLENALLKKLWNTGSISLLVEDRIFPGDLPEEDLQLPAIYFDLVEGGSHNLLSGQSSGLAYATYEFGAVADTRAECWAVLEAIRDELVGKRGDLNNDGECNVQEISLDARGKVYQDTMRRLFTGSIDLHIQWQEAKGNGE